MVTAGVPVWIAQLVLPVSFMLIAVRLAWRSSVGLDWSNRSCCRHSLGLLAQSVCIFGHGTRVAVDSPHTRGRSLRCPYL